MSRSLRKYRGEVDLDAAARNQQAAYLHRGARRRRPKELFPHLIELVEVVEVGKKHLRLHRVLKVAARGLEDAAQVVQHVARLFLDVGAVLRNGRTLPR